MSMMGQFMPAANDKYAAGNLVRILPWRRDAENLIEVQTGRGDAGWVNTQNTRAKRRAQFRCFLYVEIEDAADDELYEWFGPKRGDWDWKAFFSNSSFEADVLDRTKYVAPQTGRNLKKRNIAKGPDWGKPRGRTV